MRLDWVGLDQIIRAFNKPHTRSINVGLRTIAERVKFFVIDAAPKGETRRLSRSIGLEHPRDMQYNVTEGATHGRFVRLGTAPHPIYPVRKQALYWPGILVGHPIPMANHPGTRPNPYNVTAVKNFGVNKTPLEKAMGDSLSLEIIT